MVAVRVVTPTGQDGAETLSQAGDACGQGIGLRAGMRRRRVRGAEQDQMIVRQTQA
jgi:hypothetical protein